MDNKQKAILVTLDKELNVKKYDNVLNKELIDLKKTNNHLCITCDNLFNCDKVHDEKKKLLNEYKFIKKGLQIYKEVFNHTKYVYKVDTFIVTECLNYIKEKNREDNKDKREELIHSIMLNYFNTNTVDEAKAIINYDLEKGYTYDLCTTYRNKKTRDL